MAMDDHIPPLPKPPGHDHRNPTSPAFSKLPTPPPPPPPKKQCVPKRKRSCCCRCCICFGWFFLVFIIVDLLFVISGTLFFVWARPETPHFWVERLNVDTLNLVERSGLTYITTRIGVLVAASNKNDKVGFAYDQITIGLSSDDVNLGRVRVPRFYQHPNNMTVVKANIGVSNSLVGSGKGNLLKRRFEEGKMSLDVELKSKVSAAAAGWQTIGLMVRVTCNNVDVAKVAKRVEPKCIINFLGL